MSKTLECHYIIILLQGDSIKAENLSIGSFWELKEKLNNKVKYSSQLVFLDSSFFHNIIFININTTDNVSLTHINFTNIIPIINVSLFFCGIYQIFYICNLLTF